MPDALFADPRLAPYYDALEGPRPDLDHYVRIVADLGARSVLDLGCGTGSLALRLAEQRLRVTAIDPALASVEVARAKTGADRVRWIHGTAAEAPPSAADVAVLTGNVAQVFLDDTQWAETLGHLRAAVHRAGHLVFETRRPDRRAWEEWAAESGTREFAHTVSGDVARTFTLTDVSLPFVSFRYEYVLPDGQQVVSDSTIRFREPDEIEMSLTTAGFSLVGVGDAPDRPGSEYVFHAAAAT